MALDELAALQAEATSEGFSYYDGRWGVDRLTKELAAWRATGAPVEVVLPDIAVPALVPASKPDWQCVVEGCAAGRLPFQGAVICSGHENLYHQDGRRRVGV